MIKLECLIEVPDKYTGEVYKVGNVYEFKEDRAKQVLAARTSVTKEAYFKEYVEDAKTEEVASYEDVTSEDAPTEEVVEEKPKKKTKKSK